jgi:tetratricopeptide (TPR) repeat protein
MSAWRHNELDHTNAQKLYQEGFYHNAAMALNKSLFEKKKSRESHYSQLSRLSLQADAALCHVRSFAHDALSPCSFVALCSHAVDRHRRLAWALWRTLEIETTIGDDCETVPPTTEGDTTTVPQHSRRFDIVDALLRVCNNVAWLYLQIGNTELAMDRIGEDLHRIVFYLAKPSEDSDVWKGCTRVGDLINLAEKLVAGRRSGKSIVQLRQTVSVIELTLENTGDTNELPMDSNEDFMSTIVADDDTRLRIRIDLVNALRVHRELSSGICLDRRRFTQQRNLRLERAAELERSLDSSDSLARRTRATIRALEVLESSHLDEDEALTAARELEQLMSWRNICGEQSSLLNLLGCVQARLGNVEDALRSFYQSDKLRPSCKHTILNIAECFLSIGEVDRALALYEYARRNITCSTIHKQTAQQIFSLGSLANDPTLDEFLCWSTIVAASLKGASTVLLESIDYLLSTSNTWATVLFVFACLEAECPRRALKAIQSRKKQNLSDPIERILLNLYEADALFHTGHEAGTAVTNLDSALHILCSELVECSPSHTGTIRACIFSNRGVIHLVSGDEKEALSYFYASCACVLPTPLQSLCPHFNQALLLWKHHNLTSALEHWIEIRGDIIQDFESLPAALLDRCQLFSIITDTAESCYSTWKPLSTIPSRAVILLDLALLEAATQRKKEEAWARFLCQRIDIERAG